MRLLMNLSIRNKFMIIAVVGMLGFAGYLVFSYQVTTGNAERLARVQNVSYPVLANANNNKVQLEEIQDVLNAAVASGEMGMLEGADKAYQSLNTSLDEMAKLNDELAADIADTRNRLSEYFSLARSLSAGMISGSLDPTSMSRRAEQMNRLLTQLREDLADLHQHSYRDFSGTLAQANEASQSAVNVGVGIGLVTIAMLGLFAFLIGQMTTQNINNVVRSLREMASGEGDLTQRLQTRLKDEIGDLVNEFNAFVGNLQDIIRQVVTASEKVAGAVEGMSSVTEQTQSGMRRQRSEAEHLVTAIDEMSATVGDVARHASSASGAAADTDNEAKKGKQVVEATIETINSLAEEVEKAAEAMQRLHADTEEVGTVMDVIRGIAEQTNLLALNAAIEAARAGEHGRGFAVVADEVRTLASRTQDSTVKIEKTIEQLRNGANLVGEVMSHGRDQARTSVDQAAAAGSSLEAITTMAGTISDMNRQIATATEQQSTVANEIQKNVNQIRDIAEQSSQGAERAADSNRELAALAGELHRLVGKFRI